MDGPDAASNPGGINLDPSLLDLQIKRDRRGIPLPLQQQPVDLHIEGFLPVIIDAHPVSLPFILGLGENQPVPGDQAQTATQSQKRLDPRS